MSHLDITSKKWRVTSGMVQNLQTKEVKAVSGITDAVVRQISLQHEKTFDRNCAEAFNAGQWPN
jgi:hypothetical protein